MKTRILVAVVAIPVLLLIIFLAPVWVLGIVIGAIAAGAAWELLSCAAKGIKQRMLIYAAVTAFAISFLASLVEQPARVYELMLFLLFAVMFCELMFSFEKGEEQLPLETVVLSLLAGGVMPVLLSGIVRLGALGPVYVLLPFVVTFSCDSGAYFVGCAIGKHRLAPRLSPKKSIEGSIAGFASAVLIMLVYGLILRAFDYQVNLAVLGVYAFLGALACQLGDLGFSAIKRICGVKDYGTLIPGHGGMLDRFDSMFWTAALVELLVAWVPAISKIG